MNGDVINYIDMKYCSLCFEPLGEEFSGAVCPSCGQKTTPVNLIKRLKSDREQDEKVRSTPRFCALLAGAAYIVQLVYAVIVLLFSAGAFETHEGDVSDFMLTSYTEEELHEIEIEHFYLDKAMKCDSWEEFLEECKPLTHDIDYYLRIWNNTGIIRYTDSLQSKIPQDPLPKKETFDFGKIILMIYMGVVMMVSLLGLFACARVLLECDASLGALQGAAVYSAEVFLLSLNFLSVAVLIFAAYHIAFLNERLGGGKYNRSRLWRIKRAKNPILDSGEWCCKNCGYINSRLDSECKSCGKYK